MFKNLSRRIRGDNLADLAIEVHHFRQVENSAFSFLFALFLFFGSSNISKNVLTYYFKSLTCQNFKLFEILGFLSENNGTAKNSHLSKGHYLEYS